LVDDTGASIVSVRIAVTTTATITDIEIGFCTICCKILEIHTKGKPLSRNVDLITIAEVTEGFSGADVSAVANTAVSVVLHEYLAKYSTPEEAAKHSSEALVSMQHIEEAVKKIRIQREMKPAEKTTLPQYG
jgi:transitional endoplasmic reticulum ATPase